MIVARFKSVLVFFLQSFVVGLAVAFVIVLLRPSLLPTFDDLSGGDPRRPASYADAVEISAPAVANVYTRRLVQAAPGRDEGERYRLNISLGSAVVIDPEGYLVTNYHVVANADEIWVQLADGRIAGPEIVGLDAETDLALLRVGLGPLPAIPLGSSKDVRIGDVVLAIGNPYGLAKSVTQGIVSATGRAQLELTTYENFIQTDAAINDGNSGGALVNTLGELVGINTAVLAEDADTEGISFAIPVDLVRGVVDEIKRHGRVIRGWVGLETEELSSAESEALGLERNVGLLLTRIIDGGPAEIAGLRPGDVILSINGEQIHNAQQARLLVAALEPGDRISLEGWRNGQRFTATLTAAERPPN